jgi:hypothetical protein
MVKQGELVQRIKRDGRCHDLLQYRPTSQEVHSFSRLKLNWPFGRFVSKKRVAG